MSVATINPTGNGWSVVPGVGYLSLPKVLNGYGTFDIILSGFTAGPLYYGVRVQLTADYGARAGSWCTIDATSSLGETITEPIYQAGAGSSTGDIFISFPSPLAASALEGKIISVRAIRTNDSDVTTQATLTLGLTQTCSGSTNPSDGGQIPSQPITLRITPDYIASVFPSSQQVLQALAVSDAGVYYNDMNFSLTVVTPGLGVFAENGGTTLNRQNLFNDPSIAPVYFNISPGFLGLGQIRITNTYAANSPQYYTFDVLDPTPPPPVSTDTFPPMSTFVEC